MLLVFRNNTDFFKLYRIFFIVNCAVCFIFLIISFFLPDEVNFFNHSLRMCDENNSFGLSLLTFWLLDMLPMCIVFLVGLTFYIPILSLACSAFAGIVLALDIYAFFGNFGIFFALTMSFIRLCATWLFMWYLSYISTASVRIYTAGNSFIRSLDYTFLAKYIIWFAIFAISALVLDTAQCIMYRI